MEPLGTPNYEPDLKAVVGNNDNGFTQNWLEIYYHRESKFITNNNWKIIIMAMYVLKIKCVQQKPLLWHLAILRPSLETRAIFCRSEIPLYRNKNDPPPDGLTDPAFSYNVVLVCYNITCHLLDNIIIIQIFTQNLAQRHARK